MDAVLFLGGRLTRRCFGALSSNQLIRFRAGGRRCGRDEFRIAAHVTRSGDEGEVVINARPSVGRMNQGGHCL